MAQPSQSPARSVFGSLVLIAVIIAGGAAAFAYTAGWFSPERLTPAKVVDAFALQTGGRPPLGHRRNHAKGICFTGMFEANGGRIGAVICSGFHPRRVSRSRALQSRHC